MRLESPRFLRGPLSARCSIGYFRPIVTRLNYGAHASSGISAFINVSDSRANKPLGFSCTDYECNQHPLKLTFEVGAPN